MEESVLTSDEENLQEESDAAENSAEEDDEYQNNEADENFLKGSSEESSESSDDEITGDLIENQSIESLLSCRHKMTEVMCEHYIPDEEKSYQSKMSTTPMALNAKMCIHRVNIATRFMDKNGLSEFIEDPEEPESPEDREYPHHVEVPDDSSDDEAME